MPINVIEARDLDEFTYLMLTIVIIIINACDCTIWGYYPLGIPAVLTAQYIILNRASRVRKPYNYALKHGLKTSVLASNLLSSA